MAVKVKGDKTRDITEQERNSAVSVERLICADVGDNNNKFWNGYALANGDGFCEFGRVGKTRQHEYYSFGNVGDAQRWLTDKSHEKQNKGGGKASYTPQRTISGSGTVCKPASAAKAVGGSDLRNLAATQIKGDPETKKLVTWLADVNVHQITSNTNITYNVQTGTFTTPLGLVTPDGIVEARDILDEMSDYVVKRDWGNTKYQKYLSNYLRLVPTNVGMVRGWHETIFAASDALQKQNDILDALEAALKPVGGTPAATSKSEQVFNVELQCVTDASIIDRIKAKYQKEKGSHSDVQHYGVHAVWTVHINTVRGAYTGDGAKLPNIWELWHGTKASNLLSILKGGLVIPRSNAPHVCGRMFGDGVYFSDQSTKSIRYATGAWTGGGNIDRVFMFLANVGMGKYYTPSGYQSGSFRVPSGYDSCFAQGGKSGVANNEMIVYRTSQADLAYLIEFRGNKRGW
jgi:poly [ADP-ribose] polymerase